MQLLVHSDPAARPAAPFPISALNPAKLRAEAAQRWLLYGLLALGVFFRLFHFFHNRAFFIDELFLNVNLVKKSFWELATAPLEYQQKAPLGYLWGCRLLVLLLGKQEQALRLFSLLCGLGTVLAFVPVARFFLRGWGVVLAVGVVALAYPMVYHAVEAKQYSAELFATVLALLLYIRYSGRATLAASLAWGALGGLLLWFSFSTIFILAGIAMAISLQAIGQRDWRQLTRCLVAATLWVTSFGVIYFFFVRKFNNSGWLVDFFDKKYDAYLPLNNPIASLKWLAHKSYWFLDYALGLLLSSSNDYSQAVKHFVEFGWAGLLLILFGSWVLVKHHRKYVGVLLLPIGLTLAASAARQYPFYGRFTLFLAPLVILVLGYGFQQLLGRYKLGVAAAVGCLALVLAPSLANSARQMLNPDTFYNISYSRQTLRYVEAHLRPGDVVYVYWNMRPGYEYYKEAYHLSYKAVEESYVKNSSTSQADYLAHLKPDFAAFAGKRRLWFVYDTDMPFPIGDYVGQPAWYYDKAFPLGKVLNDYFSTIGKRTDYYHLRSFSVTLYDLSEKPGQKPR